MNYYRFLELGEKRRGFELLGIHSLDDLRRRIRNTISKICEEKGYRLDPCVLYVFRCAVYFAVEKSTIRKN
jgi:hypothetical protein